MRSFQEGDLPQGGSREGNLWAAGGVWGVDRKERHWGGGKSAAEKPGRGKGEAVWSQRHGRTQEGGGGGSGGSRALVAAAPAGMSRAPCSALTDQQLPAALTLTLPVLLSPPAPWRHPHHRPGFPLRQGFHPCVPVRLAEARQCRGSRSGPQVPLSSPGGAGAPPAPEHGERPAGTPDHQ